MFLTELLVLTLATALSLASLYSKIPPLIRQQAIAVLLLILLLFVSRYVFSHSPSIKKPPFKLISLFLSSLLIQLLIVDSGGFYSPLLVLIHLFTIGLSFLLSTTAALTFLTFTVALLIANIWLDQRILTLFGNDPWSTVIYFISFLVIVPISFMVARSYQLKDSLSRILTQHIQLGRAREQSILSGLEELVFVTDTNLSVLYSNPQAEAALGVPGPALVNQNLLTVLPLRDAAGKAATAQALSIDKALIDKTTRIINDFYFHGKKRGQVSIQIKPITDLDDKVTQIVFVITEARLMQKSDPTHVNVEKARQKHDVMFNELRKSLIRANDFSTLAKAELLHKIESDLLIALELEDHPIRTSKEFKDVALLAKQVTVTKQPLAKALGVSLSFSLPESESGESAYLSLAESMQQKSILPISPFMVPANFKWLRIMVEQLIDISLLLASSQENPRVRVQLYRENNITVALEISCNCVGVTPANQNDLFVPNFGKLAGTNLRFGSGLEGMIIKIIEEQLNFPLTVKIKDNPPFFSFTVSLSKRPNSDT